MDSAGLEGLFPVSLTLASPFPGTSRPIHVGKGPSSAPGEGLRGRRLQAGMCGGVCKGKQGLGRKASSPGLRGYRKEGWRLSLKQREREGEAGGGEGRERPG